MSFLRDNLSIIGMLSLFVGGGLLFLLIVTQVNTAFSGADISSTGKEVVADWNNQTPGIIDWFVGILFIGLPLIAFGLSFLNFVPSFFYWVAAAVSFVITVIGFIVQDMYDIVTGTGLVADTASRVGLTDFLFSNFGYYALVVWLLLAIGTYVKTQGVGAGGGFSI